MKALIYLLLVPVGIGVGLGTGRIGNNPVGTMERTLDSTVGGWRAMYARPTGIPFPRDNAYSAARANLGKILFFDPRLSSSGTTSCASCHNPGFFWGDGMERGVGTGMKPLLRRSPTILNSAWGDALMWDGRADSLEQQALMPITSEAEMNQSIKALCNTVSTIAEYRHLFAEAYPGEAIDENTVARAIATFERTVVSGQAPFDRWIAGDPAAISRDAKLGFQLFNTKAGCSKCHSNWNFTDNGFHDIGLKSSDVGRGAQVPILAMQHAFKTPTLRNVDRRAPYMHDGSEKTLEDVVDLYSRGGDVRRGSLAPEITPTPLTAEEKRQIITFLKSLTSNDESVQLPTFPR